MRKLLLTILCVAPLLCYGQLKVVERSEKKTPAWVGASGEDFVTSNGVGKTLDEAKNLAMDEVKKQILESVALNISSVSSSEINQVSGQGGEISQFSDEFKSKFAIQAAKLPFIKGISANKIDAFYWEKREDKRNGVVEYGYSIRYPYTKGEQMAMVREFEKLDASMVAKLVGIENLIDTFITTEQLDGALGEIPALMNYFFDEVRLERTKATKNAISRQYEYIKPMIGMVKKGKANSVLTIGERVITTTQKPTIKSNCATEINYKIEDGNVVIDFNEDGCVDSEDNFIEIGYRFGGKIVKERVFFDVNSENLQATVQGDVRFDFNKTEIKDSLAGVKVSFTIAVNNVSAELEAVTFNIPGISEPIVIKGCDVAFNGSGVYPIEIANDNNYRSVIYKNELPMVKGVLYLRNKANGALQSVRVTNKFTTNL